MRKVRTRIFADVPAGDDWVDDANEAEHERLQLAVVEAAKEWLKHKGLDLGYQELCDAVIDLIEFEEQKNGNT